MRTPPDWYLAQDAWFLEAALTQRASEDLIAEMAERLNAAGLPVKRFSLSFGTLNPLFQSGNITWQQGSGIERQQFMRHQIDSPQWLRSPMKRVLDGPERFFARRLPAPEANELPLLADLAAAGLGFYAVEALPFGAIEAAFAPPYDGMLISWASEDPTPFEQDDYRWLKRLNRRVAGLAKSVGREQRALSVLRTYLGPLVGPRIWQGQIFRGDVDTLRGVLWYSDLRRSTRFAEELPTDDFMALLNQLFDCTAVAIEAAGGSVLKFVGDAVLAVFPQAMPEAATAALEAVRQARAAQAKVNRERAEAGQPTFDFGVALRHGQVLFGNVGAPDRLDFTVIGPAVNEVVRMEELTKQPDSIGLVVDRAIRDAAGGDWRALEAVNLRGVERPLEVFSAVGKSA